MKKKSGQNVKSIIWHADINDGQLDLEREGLWAAARVSRINEFGHFFRQVKISKFPKMCSIFPFRKAKIISVNCSLNSYDSKARTKVGRLSRFYTHNNFRYNIGHIEYDQTLYF